MRGSVRHKDGSWRLTVTLGRDSTGQLRRRYKTVRGPDTRAGRKAAEVALAEFVASLAALVPDDLSDDPTVDDLLARWSRHCVDRGKWSAKTEAERARLIRLHISPRIGGVKLTKLRGDRLDDLYDDLADEAGLADTTVLGVHRVLHAALARAVRWRVIAHNPADHCEPPEVKRRTISPPTPAELAAITAAAPHDWFAHYVRVAASTGARRGTLTALRWRDVDFDQGLIRFERAFTIGADGPVEKGTKADQPYVVTMGEADRAALMALRERVGRHAEGVRTLVPPSSFVFSPAADGSAAYRPERFSRLFRDSVKAAGLRRIRLHDLRHFCATQLLANGHTITLVAARLGSTEQNVRSTYWHFLPSADQHLADTMDAVMGGGR